MPRLAGWQNPNVEVDKNAPFKRVNHVIFSNAGVFYRLMLGTVRKMHIFVLHQLNDPAVR